MADDQTPRAKLIKQIKLRLGFGIIDLELDPDHFDYAVDVALDRYRQKSSNALEESFLFLDVQPDVATYTLPDEVQEVRTIYRRTMGGSSGGGANIDPFSLGFANNIYMIQNPGGLGGGGSGTLATYEFATQFQSLAGRMFGRDVTFQFDSSTKRLTVDRRFGATEQVGLHVYNTKPEEVLFKDAYAKIWLRDYSIAQCKLIIGEARSMFSQIAGPSGGITLNGESMKTEAIAEILRLDTELDNYVDSHIGAPFVIG